MFCILPVDKPRGVNSRRIVDMVETAGGEKTGHAGTLDPLANGVLLLVVGPATRLVPYLQRMPKRYVARFRLGMSSESIDTERDCTPVAIPTTPTQSQLEQVVSQFVGQIDQVPPAFSAVKIAGRRAYRLAQRGRDFQVTSRQVSIFDIRLVSYEFPDFEIDVSCGSGTYIRSLGRDIARRLGTEAVMTRLCRSAIGPFDLSTCATIEQIRDQSYQSMIVDPVRAVAHLPMVQLDEIEIARLFRGVKYETKESFASDEIAAVDTEGRLHAIMRPAPDGKWRPALNFSKYWQLRLCRNRELRRESRK